MFCFLLAFMPRISKPHLQILLSFRMVKPYEITEIPAGIEKLNKDISSTWKLIYDSLSIAEVDSIMPFAQYYLDSVKMIFNRQKDIFTYRGMENFLSEWTNYAKRLESLRNVVSSRVVLLNSEGR